MSSVTVAISTYEGHRDSLDKSIDSAIDADQVIVLDNGGSCQDIADDYPVVYQKTRSLIESRNKAIELASCDYLVHLDADDWLASIPTCEGDWCYGDLMVYDTAWTTWDYSVFPRKRTEAMEFLREHRSLPIPMKAAFSLKFLHDNHLGWYEWPGIELFGEDVMTCIRYLEHDPDIRYIDPFYCYRLHAGQGSANDTRRAEWLESLDAYLKGAL